MAYFGVYIGQITDSTDPLRSGRVRISLPMLGIGSATWAPVVSPLGSTPSGTAQVGARVVVAFEGGDPSRPVVLGRVGG